VFGLSAAQTYFTGWVGERGLADLRIELFEHLQRLSLGYYERNRTGAIVSRITNDVEALDLLVTDGVSSLVQNTLVLAGTVIFMFLLDWRLALATLVILPLMGLATAWFRSRSNHAYRRVPRAPRPRDRDARRGHLRHARRPVVHAGADEPDDVPRREPALSRLQLRDRRPQRDLLPGVDILSVVATAIVLGFGGWLVVDGDMTQARSSRSCSISRTSSIPSSSSPSSTTRSSRLRRRSTASRRCWTRSPTSSTSRTPRRSSAPGHVRFDHVRFGYGDLPDVLHDFDLDVPAGTTVALVGHTGPGSRRSRSSLRASTTRAPAG
jgi:ATP-binding cassette subfamily B protein